MSEFPLRVPAEAPLPLAELAFLLDLPAPAAGDLSIRGVAPVDEAGPDELGFLADRRYLAGLDRSRAGALLVSAEIAGLLDEDSRPRLVVEDAHRALATLLDRFFPLADGLPGIHPTAVIASDVQTGDGVSVGPYAVIEAGVRIGRDTRVGSHSVIGAGARIGAGAHLHPHSVVYPGAVLGDRVVLKAGARAGVEGFGWVFVEGGHRKIPQVGRCTLEDDVELGANSTVDRGSIGETRVEAGSKIDNLVQLGHNVLVGRHALLAAQVGVAGSTRIGKGVLAGGQAGIAGHLEVGDGARLAAQAGITGDVAPGETVMGFPARPRGEFLRSTAAQKKVPELLRRVKALEEEIGRLRARLDAAEAGNADDPTPSSP